MSSEAFKPNWLAIAAVILFLVTVGWLLGLLASAPKGKTITCPQEDLVRIVGVDHAEGHHVLVYCEE